jgi:hypothetical protein
LTITVTSHAAPLIGSRNPDTTSMVRAQLRSFLDFTNQILAIHRIPFLDLEVTNMTRVRGANNHFLLHRLACNGSSGQDTYHLHGTENSDRITLSDLGLVLDADLDHHTRHGCAYLAGIGGIGLNTALVLHGG